MENSLEASDSGGKKYDGSSVLVARFFFKESSASGTLFVTLFL